MLTEANTTPQPNVILATPDNRLNKINKIWVNCSGKGSPMKKSFNEHLNENLEFSLD